MRSGGHKGLDVVEYINSPPYRFGGCKEVRSRSRRPSLKAEVLGIASRESKSEVISSSSSEGEASGESRIIDVRRSGGAAYTYFPL